MKKKYHGKKAVARKAKRTYRDSLFRSIYAGKDERSKRWLLSLYNALSGKNYTDTAELEITTLEDVIYVSMKNDLSFLLDSQLCLFEHQSTVNPNMPLRGLMYFGQLYQNEVERQDKDIYGASLVKIPSPRFVVFYNGNVEQPNIVKYRLSDAFEVPDESGEFEWTATVINITAGHNETLQKKCKSLYDYCSFVNRVKENLDKGLKLNSAVNEAVEYAVRNNFLEGFFKEHKMKLSLLTEFNREAYDRHRRAEGFEEGLSQGARENALSNARNLLSKSKLSPDMIAECCSLPLSEVLALKEELTQPS